MTAFLRDIGIKRGDVVGVFAENCIEFPLVVYGCFYLGATVNACNPTYTREEVQHVLQLTRPKVIFTSAHALKNILHVSTASNCDFIQDIVSLESCSSARGKVWLFEDVMRNNQLKMEGNFKPAKADLLNTVGLIQMSSGTTGLLKAVENTQDNILSSMSINL